MRTHYDLNVAPWTTRSRLLRSIFPSSLLEVVTRDSEYQQTHSDNIIQRGNHTKWTTSRSKDRMTRFFVQSQSCEQNSTIISNSTPIYGIQVFQLTSQSIQVSLNLNFFVLFVMNTDLDILLAIVTFSSRVARLALKRSAAVSSPVLDSILPFCFKQKQNYTFFIATPI